MSVYSRRVWVALTASLCLAISASAGIVTYDVTGTASWGMEGNSSNVVVILDVAAALGLPSGSSVTMTGMGWDVTLTAVDPSWLLDMVVGFGIPGELSEILLRPGGQDPFPGTRSYSSDGIVDLTDSGIPDLVLPNGLLRLEFYEIYDDIANAPDGTWDSGYLYIAEGATQTLIPAPASAVLALPGLLALCVLRRRMF